MTQGLRRRVAAGEPLLGTLLKSCDPAVGELLAFAGFDLLIADLEHSTLSLGETAAVIRSAPVPVLVRLPARRLADAARLIEAGAAGLQVPDVDGVRSVRSARAEMRFSDGGRMGLALSHRAARYGAERAIDYIDTVQESTVLVAQVESAKGVDALPRLLATPDGPDVWFLGPMDLSRDLGHPGEVAHPDVQAALDRAAGTILDGGGRLGAFAADEHDAGRWRAKGATLVVVGSDVALLAATARRVAARWRDTAR